VISALAPAKINLALVVGPVRQDGLHEVATIMQRLDLNDTITLEPAGELAVEGFAGYTLVRRALEAVAGAAGAEPRWRATIDKRIPVAAGLGGGSSDAAAAMRLANELLGSPVPPVRLHELAAALGADVPFFLEPGPQLGTGDGTNLEAIDLRQDFTVLLLLPHGETKQSTAEVYARFTREGGFRERSLLLRRVAADGPNADLGSLPPNDLVRSPHTRRLLELGAFRADVSGAGPTLYALFADDALAEAAA